MNQPDAQECLTHLAALWREWDSDPVEDIEWLRSIENIRCSPDRFKRAATRTKQNTHFRRPAMKDILATLRLMPLEGEQVERDNPVVETGWWVVRQGTMDTRPLLLTPKDSTSDEHCRRLCMAMLQGNKDNAGLEELYPGEWTIVGPACKTAFEALRVGNPEWEARYQAAWSKAQARIAAKEPARQSAEDFFARAGQ